MSRTPLNPALFKAYDIRGVVSTDLTPAAVRQIGQAFASQALQQHCESVVIARDGRLHSPQLAQALAEGLQSGGCDVIDIGQVPTPVLYFATHHLKTGTGIMITGSHNPPDYNGLKLMIDGDTLYGDDITALYQRIENGTLNSGQGDYREQSILDAYLDRISGDVTLAHPMNIAIDCGNGVGGVVAGELFRRLGCTVTELFCEVDGSFPNHHPDPSKPENLAAIRESVVQQQLDLGFAFDGDADRVGLIDNEGHVIWPDRQMMLYAEDVLSRNPGAEIIYDIKSSYHLGHIIKQLGGQALMWKSGHSLIKAKMKETGALLAGEMVGHIFFKDRWYGFDDGLYSAARMLEILSYKTGTAADIFKQLPDSFNTPEIHIPFKEGEHIKFMTAFKQQANFENADISTIDGLRVSWDNGWGLIRSSNTTPCLVLRFEADDEATLKQIQARFREQILRTNPTVALTF